MIIYKKDSKGKIRYLNISVELDMLKQESWILHWKPIFNSKKCKWKNIWKSNETSPSQQASKQARALIDKKLSEWYFETVKEALSEEVILPMLAKDYKKEKHKINWNNWVYVQPKFDGMRCLAVIKDWKATLYSRKGKKIDTMNHIVKDLESKNMNDIILDWELYCHWESFQENMKMIKKYREWFSENIKYNIYDCIVNSWFSIRTNRILPDFTHCKEVFTKVIYSEDELIKQHKVFLSEWYEWTMVRHSDEWYVVNKRSSQLLKYKDFIDKTYKIIDVVPSEARPEQWVIVCEWFKASLKMSHADREEMLTNKNKYIWATAEVRFFEYTDDWLPRFPVCCWIREDK